MLSQVREQVWQTPYGLRGGPGRYHGETPFGIWLAEHVLGDASWCDEDTGDVEWRYWLARVGRRVVTQDSFGFVQVHRFCDEDHARAWFDCERDDYEVWASADEDDDYDGSA